MANKRQEAARRAKPSGRPKPGLKFEKSAGAVVFHGGKSREYLLILSTYWEFPKGQVEQDESETQAALREVREETRLDVQLVPGFRHEINYFYQRGGSLIKKQVVYFLAHAADMNVTVSWEHSEAKWLGFDGALKELRFENARQVLTRAEEFLSHENTRD